MNVCKKVIWNIVLHIFLVFAVIVLWNEGYQKITSVAILAFISYTFRHQLTRKNRKRRFAWDELVIITGCDSGLGYGLALHCQSLGATVIAGVHAEHSSGANKLRQSKIVVLPLDVTNDKSIDKFREDVVKYVREHQLKLTAIVNNIGIMVFGEFEWQTHNQIYEQININLIGTIKLTHGFLSLARFHRSRFIFVCSHCALEPLPGVAVYGASKAAILAFATSLRVELKKYDVKVTCFIPGSFVTESNIMAKQKDHFQEMRNNMKEEAKIFYADYFERYVSYLSPIARKIEPVKLSNQRIFDTFEGCIFDELPKSVYKCEPWRYTIYHTLCKLSSTDTRDELITEFVQMPRWKTEN